MAPAAPRPSVLKNERRPTSGDAGGTSTSARTAGFMGTPNRSRTSYTLGNFVHFDFDFDDFTTVSMNAIPITPSSTVGKS